MQSLLCKLACTRLFPFLYIVSILDRHQTFPQREKHNE